MSTIEVHVAKKKSVKAKPKVKSQAKPTKTKAKKAGTKAMAQPKTKAASKPQKTLGKAKKKQAAKAGPKLKAKTSRHVKAQPQAKSNGKPFTSLAKSTPPKRTALVPVADIFTPLDDRVIVEETIESNRTAGGLYIPDTVSAADRPKQGRVLAVGRGHRGAKGRIRPLDVQIDEVVIFDGYHGAPIKIGDRELLLLRESEILGIIRS